MYSEILLVVFFEKEEKTCQFRKKSYFCIKNNRISIIHVNLIVMNSMNKINQFSILVFLLLSTGVLKAQIREYVFGTNVVQEGWSITKSDSSGFQFKYAFNSILIDSVNDNGYSGHQIKGSGITLPSRPGTPNLPVICRYIAIPNGATASVEIRKQKTQTLSNIDLMAAPPIHHENDTTPTLYEKDSSIYFSNAFYPSQTVSVSDTFSFRGVNTIVVSICPYQFNPVTKELVVHYDIDANVSFVGGNGSFGDNRLRSPYWDPILMQNLANYYQLPVIDYEARMDNWLNSQSTGCEYLIVIPNEEGFRQYANQLKNFRIRQGIFAEVKSLSEMGCSNSDDLKAFFHNAYFNWDIAPVAVCLLGDHNENTQLGIPSEGIGDMRDQGEPNNPDPNQIRYITDNGYADISGNGLPDITFSRLVASNPSEAELLVSKVLEYEYLSPNMNPSYYDHPITSTAWSTERWYQICTEAIGGYWRKLGKNPVRINELCNTYDIPGALWSTHANTGTLVDYFGPDGLEYIPAYPDGLGGWDGGTGVDLVDAINSGSMLLFHRGHGESHRWVKPNLEQSLLGFLNNEDALTFIVSIDCQTGMFDDEEECLIEGFMRSTSMMNSNNAGAVGCIAPTTISYSFVNDVFALGLFDFFSPDFLPDQGQFVNYEGNWLPAFANVSAKYFLNQNDWADNTAAKPIMFDIYTAHCDAFLRLFSVVPQTMDVVHPTSIDMSQGVCMITAPEGAVIAMTVDNSILKVATATGDPQLLFFEPQDPNTIINLVVTKQDYLRYEALITNCDAYIDGLSELEMPQCDNYLFMANIPNSNLFTYSWSCSSNLKVVSSSMNTVSIRPLRTGDGTIFVDIYYNDQLYAHYSKNVVVISEYTLLNTAPISINDNTVWSSENLLLQYDVEIEPYSTLTISGSIVCSPNTTIIVKQGGHLRIAGGHIMGVCEEELWEGIQVWGDSSKHQFIENGHCWQGCVELSEGAIVENAIVGIDVWRPGDYSMTGGVVKARNAQFKNNATAVSFHTYENHYQHPYQTGGIVIKDNLSFFKNCEFSVDEHYLGPDEFETHVRLYDVRGVKFYGCSFNYSDTEYSKPCTVGVYAYNAGFRIDGICVSNNHDYPCQTYNNSTFDGFCDAVVSVNDGSVGSRQLLIKNTHFANNSFGVYALRSSFATILDSNFAIGQNDSQCAVGIFVEHTPIFTIEQNTFGVSQYYPNENYGLVIKHSKSQNVVYKNVFSGLYCANLSIGRNNTWLPPRNGTGPKLNIFGLEYRCNENTYNICDFYIKGGSSTYKQGIQNNQGTIYTPANNTFSQTSLFQFENFGSYGINYYYDPDYDDSFPDNTVGVTIRETVDSDDCSSHYGIGGLSSSDTLITVLSYSQRLQRETDYYNAYSAYENIKSVYENMIDGGDTYDEINDITIATPTDMWDLRAQLLGHSPYLSSDVLVNMVDRGDIFPKSILFEILASNPDELKNDTLIHYLQSMNDPLPEYMICLLRQMANGITARTAMESQLAKYSQEYRMAAGDIIRSILSDTIVDKTALIGWLGNMHDLESDREIVGIYLEEGNYSDAIDLANLFPDLYGLVDGDLVEHDDYLTLINLYRELYLDGRNTMQVDSAERALLKPWRKLL